MQKQVTIISEYSQQYRKKLGFSSQASAKDFFGGKDIVPVVDFKYIKSLNIRLGEFVDRLNDIVVPEIKNNDLDSFKKEHVDSVFNIIKDNNILPRLNNQGRRSENVYFSWMRGYLVSTYFLKALGVIFEIDLSSIELIGEDDLRSLETFKRTPTADLKITLKNGEKLRIEIQAGFTGVNDIKQHKVKEAQKVFQDFDESTIAIHIDLYNGQVAFLKLNDIDESKVQWEKREQFEGQMVFSIDQKYFIWKLTENPIKYKDIIF